MWLVAFVVAFAGTGAFAAAVAAAFAVAAAAAVALFGVDAALNWMQRRGAAGVGYVGLVVLLAGLLWAALRLFPWAGVVTDARSLFLFLGVLPLVNALFDCVSLGVTLALVRLGYRRGWLAVVYGLADLAFAALLFLALGCTLIAVVHWMNETAGVAFVPLGELFADLGDWRSYWWVYAMVFSTALPTLAHALLALLSLMSLSPGALTRPLLGWVARARHDPVAMALAPLMLTALAAGWLVVVGLGVAAVFALGVLSFDVITAQSYGPAETAAGWLHAYLGLFRTFAVWIGALPHGADGPP